MSAQKPRRQRTPGTWVFIPLLGGALIFGSVGVRDFIGKWESGSRRVLVVYADKLAGGLPTVCDGITRHVTKTPIIVGERWSDAKCDAEEKAALTTLQYQLVKCFKILPPQSVFDMATSHAWNNGVPNTCSSGALRAWNAGQFELGCRRLAFSDGGKAAWSYTCQMVKGTKVCTFVQGLQNRRVDERGVCTKLSAYNPGPAQ